MSTVGDVWHWFLVGAPLVVAIVLAVAAIIVGGGVWFIDVSDDRLATRMSVYVIRLLSFIALAVFIGYLGSNR